MTTGFTKGTLWQLSPAGFSAQALADGGLGRLAGLWASSLSHPSTPQPGVVKRARASTEKSRDLGSRPTSASTPVV